MGTPDLRHLAVIAAAESGAPEDPRRAVLTSCAEAARIARAAFAFIPGLQAFSWLDTGVDNLLARSTTPGATRACSAGARAFADLAADLGVSLRICGRTDDLPDAELPPPRRSGKTRSLLWFQRYSGRDEIARAAGRFLRAHPEKTLVDGELDAWMDSAGVPDPDLLLYVGGSLEPHDVLLWQGSYAEIWHTQAPLASFSTADLQRAVSEYSERQRRFGR